jgi:Xanthine and CO dehydrogenases maturation factor, XdhC/CoxF family
MKELRDIISLWEKHRGPCALATLVRATGSSYRRPGARLLITSTGHTAGALSAGCIEDDVTTYARDVIASGETKLVSFDTRRRFGCSGSIEIFIERLNGQVMNELCGRIRARESCDLVTVYERAERRGTSVGSVDAPDGAFVHRIQPVLRLIIIGDGADAHALGRHARLLGWEPKMLSSIPEVSVVFDSRTAAVIATHHFGRDCAALRFLLPLGLEYVGLLGPRRRREELLVDAIDSGAAMNSRLFAPAGLHLGAETPDEIALSIIAEIQGVFAGATVEHLRDRKAPIHAISSPACTALAR